MYTKRSKQIFYNLSLHFLAITATATTTTTTTTTTIGELLDSLNDFDVENSKSPMELQFNPVLVDRYPQYDYEGVEVPEEMQIFCFPDGLQLRESPSEPTFFHTVLTNSSVGYH